MTLQDVRALADRVRARRAAGEIAVDESMRRQLESLDHNPELPESTVAELQRALAYGGMATHRPLVIPVDDEPYWLRSGQPLAGWQSRNELPASFDVVIIGAGLTGASIAYHLAAAARTGMRVAVLERGDPVCEASGRNGGNFELIPENSLGLYEGLARERLAFLQRCYPSLPIEVLELESQRQASLVLGFSLRNRDLMKAIILRERIACDLTTRGWVHMACTEAEEQGLCDEVLLAAQQGQRIELWSRRKIHQELGIVSDYLARFVPGDGTFHPFKYACGLLTCAIRDGVELYTQTGVNAVVSEAVDRHRIETGRGTIVAKHVVAATNAFTAELFPELRAIEPRQSQIQLTDLAPDRAHGRVITCDDGPVFFNQPRHDAHRGTAPLLMGGGPEGEMPSPASRQRSEHVHEKLLELRDRFYPELRGRPPSAEWVGPMGFTPDQLPAIGELRPGVIIAAGYNGYGGSYTTAAGLAVAEMLLAGGPPSWLPADVFSPRRLVTAEPIFMSDRQGLWRIASSLCVQLRAVNRRLSEALALDGEGDATAIPGQTPPRVSRMLDTRELALPRDARIDAADLASLTVFSRFSADELDALAQRMIRLDLKAGTRLFTEGEAGHSCFIVIGGVIDVSVKVRNDVQLLAQLGPGTVFGQVSLIEGTPRTASCSVQRDAVLAQLGHDASASLLSDESPIALKLLAALTDGLVDALRNADRRLMQLEAQRDAGMWTTPLSLDAIVASTA